MAIPWIFQKYILRQFFTSFLMIGSTFFLVIFLVDFAQLSSQIQDLDLPFADLLELQILRMPDRINIMLPYVLLFSCMYAFNKLNVDKEIIIARSMGLNTSQIIMPIVTVTFLAGILQFSVLNYIGVLTYNQFLSRFNSHKNITQTTVTITKTGVWLREGTKDGYRVINGDNFDEEHMSIIRPNIVELDKNNIFLKSYSAQTARLKENKWVLTDAFSVTLNNKNNRVNSIALPTKTTVTSLRNLFKTAGTISFWQLPQHIKNLKYAGLNATKYQFVLHELLSTPVLFSSIAMFAFFFTGTMKMRSNRKYSIIFGILFGFGMFFYLNLIKSLVFVSPIPSYVMGWIGAVSMFLVALVLLLSSEKIAK